MNAVVNIGSEFIKIVSSYGNFFRFLFFIIITASVIVVNKVDGQQYGNIAGTWNVSYGNDIENELRFTTRTTFGLNLTIYDVDMTTTEMDFYFQVKTANEKIATVALQNITKNDLVTSSTEPLLGKWQGIVEIEGKHFGYSSLYVVLYADNGMTEQSPIILDVAVIRGDRLDDKIFTYTAAIVVMLMFINLGTVLDLKRLKSIFLRPIGPFISFCARFGIMPGLGLGLGYLFFPNNTNLQLALFFTALAPSGGLANVCTVFLKGNINLSIVATTLNSILSLAMLPLWILILARVDFNDSNLSVPFLELGIGCLILILAVSLGVTLRIFIPKTTKYIFKFLKPLSVILSLCLVGLTVGINAFAFQQLTVMVFLAAFVLPIAGYLLAFGLSKIFCLSYTDSMTIGVETGVLNMTVPILLLQYSFEDPQRDLLIIVPIMSSLMSLILVLFFYVLQRLLGWNIKDDPDAFDEKKILVKEKPDTIT